MLVSTNQLHRRRVPREAKRLALALAFVSPIFLSVLWRRSIRGGGVGGGLLLMMALFVVGAALVSYVRLRLRSSAMVAGSSGAVLVATGSYREVFRHLHDWDAYEPAVKWGSDVRSSPSRIAIHTSVVPARFVFFDAWGPSPGTITAPDGLELVVWARGDKIRAIELIHEGRSLELDGTGPAHVGGVR